MTEDSSNGASSSSSNPTPNFPNDDDEQLSSSSSMSDDGSSTGSAWDDNEEVDQLLEQGYFERNNSTTPNENSCANNIEQPIERTKTVLKKRGQDYFEVLPEGWIEVTHSSGMPLYLHKQSRVCTMSKPYYLGNGSVRKHELPISAIPCLQYRRELEKEQRQADEVKQPGDSVGLETVKDHKREKWMSAPEVKEYCDKLFDFVEIKIRKFKTWADRRKHNSLIREQRQRPSLPNDTKLITCSSSGGSANSKKEFVMNPAGKSCVCILHEFVQHTEKVQPRYIYKELENATTPYSATAEINGTLHGVGFGKSKKDAKEEAARETLEILIPEIKDIFEANVNKPSHGEASQDLKFFDNIKINDSRVTELCAKAGLQSPYQILNECLKRNAGTCNTEIFHDVQLIKHHKNIYTMKVNEHEAKVECKNKREGKQKAAQEILQKLHPQVSSWGGLLLMYGRGSCKTPKEKKEEEQKITELQSTASPNTPNYAILSKLKEEMLKLTY